MKNQLLTIAAFVAFTTAGFAQQNSGTNNQVGDYQKNQQTQTGKNQTSTVNQNEGSAQNYGNTAITIQTGTKANVVMVNQNDGSSSNFTRVDQTSTGMGNQAIVSQSKNSGGGTPTAPVTGVQQPIPPGNIDGNYVNLLQVGSNTATLTQDGGTLGGSNGNVSNMYQYGSSNASITQSNNALGNGAAIYQGDNQGGVGNVNGNEASVSQQGGALGRSQNNIADIKQEKSGQTGRIIEENLSIDNIANIMQLGGKGTAIADQSNNSQRNNAAITQFADASGTNQAYINQLDNSHDNRAAINQHDNSSLAVIDQVTETANNEATINQGSSTNSGTGNTATMGQANAYAEGGMTGNKATIDQNTTRDGGNNEAQVFQGRDPSVTTPRVVALGVSSQNKAYVSQQGSNNAGLLFQAGDKQDADIKQTGKGNIVKGTTLADFSDYATQYGMSNSLTVKQDNIGAPGVTNTAASFQYGTGNVSTFTQTGNN